MNTHKHISKYLPVYVLGDLDEPRTSQVQQHLAHCALCRQQVSHMKNVLDIADEMASAQVDASLQTAARKALNNRMMDGVSGRGHPMIGMC